MKDYLPAVLHGAIAGMLICTVILPPPIPAGVVFIVGPVIGGNIAGMLYFAMKGGRQ